MVIEVRIAMLTGREVTEERAGLWAGTVSQWPARS